MRDVPPHAVGALVCLELHLGEHPLAGLERDVPQVHLHLCVPFEPLARQLHVTRLDLFELAVRGLQRQVELLRGDGVFVELDAGHVQVAKKHDDVPLAPLGAQVRRGQHGVRHLVRGGHGLVVRRGHLPGGKVAVTCCAQCGNGRVVQHSVRPGREPLGGVGKARLREHLEGGREVTVRLGKVGKGVAGADLGLQLVHLAQHPEVLALDARHHVLEVLLRGRVAALLAPVHAVVEVAHPKEVVRGALQLHPVAVPHDVLADGAVVAVALLHFALVRRQVGVDKLEASFEDL
mmetsp:Transcript_47995/g.121123  ORF Transcript_47995/g.121123 Transcript_47995/m.121123 type:complete len:291 (+) Transcript_47995:853-1725(+)